MKNTKHSIAYEFSVGGTHDEIIEIRRSLTHQSQISGKIKKLKNDHFKIHLEGIKPFEISINLKSKPHTVIVKLLLRNMTPNTIRLTHAALNDRLGKVFFERLLNESNFHAAVAELNIDTEIQNSLTLLKIDDRLYGNIDGLFKTVDSAGLVRKAEAILHEYSHANKARKLFITATCIRKPRINQAHYPASHSHMEQLTVVCAELINEEMLNKKKTAMYDQGVPLNRKELLKKRGINYSDRAEIELSVPILPTWKEFIAYCSLKFRNGGKGLIKIKVIKAEL